MIAGILKEIIANFKMFFLSQVPMRFIFIFMVFIFHHSAFSHSGGTDKHGCHGGSKPYHCHNDGNLNSGGHYDPNDLGGFYASDGSFYADDGNIYDPYIRAEPNDSVIIGRWKEDIVIVKEEDGYGVWAWVPVGLLVLGIFSGIIRVFGWLEYLLTGNTSVKEADYFTSTGFFLSLLTLGGLALHFFG